jgi:hypothetical protein
VADAEDFLDQQIDGFGGSVADRAGAEVGQEFFAPGGDGAGEPGQLSYPGVDAQDGPAIQADGGLLAVLAAVDGA